MRLAVIQNRSRHFRGLLLGSIIVAFLGVVWLASRGGKNFDDSLALTEDQLIYDFGGLLDRSKVEWYSEHLQAMREPPLTRVAGEAEVYRFLWLRSFHRPIAIRAQRLGG